MKSGATEGNRTPDRLITNQLLYQLSYGGRTLWLDRPLLRTFITVISLHIMKLRKKTATPKELLL
jgi:hypothetical protein